MKTFDRILKMILLFSLFVCWWSYVLCLEEERNFQLDGEIRHFAVASESVYISTEESLYQLRHDLTLVRRLAQKGVLVPTAEPNTEHFHRVSEGFSNATFRVNVLLPFAENKSLIVCGVTDNECGYCEVVELGNISRVLYREPVQVGSLRRGSSSSVSFLVRLEKKKKKKKKKAIRVDSYILTAIQYDESEEIWCTSDSNTVNLQNTDDGQVGGIFSFIDTFSTPTLKAINRMEFVDGFQIESTIYLLSNALQSCSVRLFWLEDRGTKTNTLKSLRGATLRPSDGGEGWTLKASSVLLGGEPVLWSGVFSVDGGDTDTELLVFDISPDLTGEPDTDPDLFIFKNKTETVKTLTPKAVLLRQSFMTSVLAVRHKAWMVFFIGTIDGQLIKLTVDRNYNTAIPKVLYKSSEDWQVFPRMHLDPADHKYLYLAFRNEMKRVPVSKCSSYRDQQECSSAQDPHCGWCSSKGRCTFEDDCENSDWFGIPDVFERNLTSHKVVWKWTGQKPQISSITPGVVSFHGRNHAVLSGRDLQDVVAVRIKTESGCSPRKSPVRNKTDTSLTFHIPKTDREGKAKVCALLPDSSCHGDAEITYQPSPSCSKASPGSSWNSGKRKITVIGSHLEFVEWVVQGRVSIDVRPPRNSRHQNLQNLTYDSPAASNPPTVNESKLVLKVANHSLICPTLITYYPEPEFTSFTSTRLEGHVHVVMQKQADHLEMRPEEFSVWGVEDGKEYLCIVHEQKHRKEIYSLTCETPNALEAPFEQLMIKYGDKTVWLQRTAPTHQILMILRVMLIPCIIAVFINIWMWQKRLTNRENQL